MSGQSFTEPRGSVTMLAHQPDEGVFRSALAEDIDWKPFAAFPPSARLAVVVGHPSEPGPYVVRVRLPSGVKLPGEAGGMGMSADGHAYRSARR
jgi:hypothetical protein